MSGTADLAMLLGRVAAGDRDAFRLLYDASSPQLFAVVLRIVRDRSRAEEVLQETYVRIWRGAASYTAARGPAIAWLTAIARNRAIDAARSAGSRQELPPTAEIEPGADSIGTIALERCLDELGSEWRDCVVLAYAHGYSREELAARFARPVGTIKGWLARCLLQLRDCLGDG